ncbi:helix-turn-helix domain-containing protein [Candidatus Dojkabacteria bacterium]|nr:helix-turn-helix domain-containing protein [Candidatus Dojkabacteria bacterium]
MLPELRKLKPPYNDVKARQAEIGYQVKFMRRNVGVSATKLSELTGLSTKTIWKLERGEPVKLESLLKVLDVLQYEIEFLSMREKGLESW